MNFKRYLKGAWEGADFWDKKENNDQGQQRAAAQPAKLPQSDKPNRGLVGVLKGAANQVNPFDGGRTWDTSRRNVTPGTQNKFKINDNTPGFQFSNNSLTRGLSRGWDQANILDSGRSWKTRTPDDIQRNQSGLSQAGKTLLPASGKFLNTAGLAGEQVINTTRMLAAQASNNQEALRNSIKASDDDYERYTKPGAGIFGTGTYFRSADEAKSGDFKTVAKRIGGGIAETGFEVASLGVGSFAGKKALDTAGKAGIKKAIVSQAPALAKTAVLNAGQAGASAYNQDANARGIAVSALTGAGLGTAADIGLGLGGAVAAKQAKAVATKAVPIAKDIAQESSKLFRDQGGFIANPLQPNEPIKPKIAQPSARPDPMADLPDLVVTRLSEQKTKKIPDFSTKDYNNSLKEFAEEVQAYNKLKNAQEPPIQQADKIDPLESLKQEADVLGEIRPIRQFAEQYKPKDANDMSALRSFMAATGQLENMGIKVKNYERIVNNFIKRSGYDGNGTSKANIKNSSTNGRTGTKLQSPDSSRVQPVQEKPKINTKDTPRTSRVADYNRALEQARTNIKENGWTLDTVKEKFNAGLKDQNLSNRDGYTELDAYIKEKYGSIDNFYNQATQSQPPKSPLANDPLESLKQEAKPPANAFQDTLPSKTRPDSIRELVKRGGNPLYHDTNANGVLGILDSGEIRANQAPFSSIAGQGKRVSTTRNFDNYSRYGKSPYRFVIDETKTGQKAIPDNREEFESIFKNNVKTDSVDSLTIDVTNPELINDMNNGRLAEVIAKAKEKGIRVETFEGKILPDEYANKEIQQMTKDKFTKEFGQATQSQPPKSPLAKDPLESLKQEARTKTDPNNWRNAVDGQKFGKDPDTNANILSDKQSTMREIARVSRSDKELSDILDRAEALKKDGYLGDNANLAWDVQNNPGASGATKARASKLYKEITAPQVGKTDPLESLKQEAKPFVIPKTNSTDVTKLLNKDLDPLPTSPVNGKYVAEEVKNVLRGAETKERGFISTIKSSDKTPSSVKSIETGTYSIKSDKQRIADAQAFIRENPAKARELALNPKSDMDVTIGNQLIDHYIATGQHKAMQEVVSGMAESGTELGRAIHAFADYDKTTPGGAVKFAEAAIRKYNKANPDKQLALQPEQVEALVNTAKQIQEMPEGRQRNIASHELINQVNELIPSTFADKALTVWKAGLLTSMRTTARNVFGNTIHGVAEIAKDVPASLADRLMALKTGNRSKTFTVKGAAQGIGEGLSHAKDMMKHGYDPTEALAGYDIKAVTWGKGPVEQGLKKYTDLVFRSLGAQDQVFYHSAFNRSLYDQALASAKNTAKKGDDNFVDNLVKNPTEGMKVQAVIDASKATFKDENMLRDLATKVKRGLGKTEGGKVVSELVMPFVGVPSSVASQMLSYSPAGLVKGLATGSKAVRQKNSILQRQASHEIGRGAVGSGLLGLGAYLTNKGLMTGNPKDQKEAEQWKLEGKQPNSVMIGGKWRSINSVGPEALLTLAGSKLESGRQNNAGMGELAGQLGKDFTQQTFLQGVQGPLNAINDPGRYGSSYVSGQVGSIFPNIFKDTVKAMDDKQRQINSPIDALKAGTPILRNNLLPKLDVLGNELKQEPSGLNNFIDLFNSKTPIKNSVIDETKKFSSADLSITPSALDKSLKESGVSIKLTPEQRTSLQKAIGTQTQAMWKETIKSPRYQSLSIEEQSKAMSKMYSDARQAEIRKFVADNQLGQYSQDFSGKPGKIDKGAKAILSGTSSVDKYLRTDTGSTIKDRYDALKDEISDKNNGWSDIKRIEKEREFAKLSVQKEYSDDLIDLYGWSKDRIKSYAENSKNPDQTIGKLLAYEDAMIKAGMLSKSKLRDKYGNLSLSSTGNSGSKGGKGRKSSKSSGGKRARKFDYKIDGFAKTAKSGKSLRQLLNEAKMRKTA